jgi:hypothetical protein
MGRRVELDPFQIAVDIKGYQIRMPHPPIPVAETIVELHIGGVE